MLPYIIGRSHSRCGVSLVLKLGANGTIKQYIHLLVCVVHIVKRAANVCLTSSNCALLRDKLARKEDLMAAVSVHFFQTSIKMINQEEMRWGCGQGFDKTEDKLI